MADVIAPQQQALANYPFNDVAQGISNVVFYGGQTTEGASTDHIFSSSTFYSDPIVYKVLSEGDIRNPTELFDVDFDLTFGAPRVINGSVIINVALGIGDAESGAEARAVTIDGQFLLYHVDGAATETLLGSAVLDAKSFSFGDNEQAAHMFNIIINVSNQKFREGEKLRLTVKGIFSDDQNGRDRVVGIGCDPMNRNDLAGGAAVPQVESTCFPDSVDTNLLIQVPFKIDV